MADHFLPLEKFQRQKVPPFEKGVGGISRRPHTCTKYLSWILISTVFLCAGCSAFFAPQTLSENYALDDGVRCDAPEAVDGDLKTASNRTRIHITLPEEKSIRRIIIHSPNISNFVLYKSTGPEGDWRPIKSVKGNELDKVVINTQVITDKIRMFVSDTRGTRFAKPGRIIEADGLPSQFSRQVDVRPVIQEIELYGLVDSTEKVEPTAPLF